MNNLFQAGKNILKDKIKKKILLTVIPAIAPYVLIVFGAVIVIMMIVAPILQALQAVESFASSIATFFDKVGNFLEGRGFREITKDVVDQKETEFNTELTRVYQVYYTKGVQLDAPLILATIYYPMNIAYDEDEFAKVNDLSEEDQYDYWKDRKEKLTDLVNNSISMTTTTYSCVAVTTKDDEGNESTYYKEGDIVSTDYMYPFDGNTDRTNGACTSTSSIKKYTYTIETAKYDQYLANDKKSGDDRDGYIVTSKEYNFPTDLSDATQRKNKLHQIVLAIHDLAKLFQGLFADSNIAFGGMSALCPSGITIVGSDDSGTYPLEQYVAGVISAENNFIDSNQPDNIESMKAQAVAARTYALKQTDYCTKSIGDSSSSQNFSRSINDKAQMAANQTAGQVLTYKGEIFMSEYDSFYCKGSTTCEYKKEPFIDSSGNTTWDPSRATNTHIVTISQSMAARAAGGHGHGMSQLGSNYLQTQGWKYDAILKYFYADGVQITQFIGSDSGKDGEVVLRDGTYVIPKGQDSGKDGSKGSGPRGLNVFFWKQLSGLIDSAAQAGYNIGITDAWRSYDSQVQCKKEKPDLCAEPGHSLHGWGIAADLNFYGVSAATDWVHAHAAQYGLEFPMSYEPWHIQPINLKYE